MGSPPDTPLWRFMDWVADAILWCAEHPLLAGFAFLAVLLVLTQPPELWAALRRPKVPRVPCSECGQKQPLPPTNGRKCRGCGVLLYPVDKHGKIVKW